MTPLLEIQDLTVRFGGLTAVDRVSFRVGAGEICALIGPNGAGKTTLFDAITGNTPKESGRVVFRGAEIQHLPPHDIAARGARRTFQDGGLFGHLTALENVLTGLHSDVKSGFFGLLFGGGAAAALEMSATRKARELLRLMELEAIEDHPARELSGGQQRMVEIVRALATDPPLLLLDEPAVGLAPQMRERLGQTIRGLVRERKIGVLLIEHAIELVMSISDRVIVLNYGKKVADGTPAEVRADKNVLEAYLGHA